MKNYIIKIAKPCTEDWNKMTQAEKGRFCGVCEKEVVDFSSFRKNEIVDYLSQHKNICGRIPEAYLEDNKIIFSDGLIVKGVVAVAINLLVLLTATETLSQEKIVPIDPSVNVVQRISKKDISLDVSKRIISGTVYDDEGYPLPTAIISINKDNVGLSDFEGNFRIEFPKDIIFPFQLTFAFIGFNTESILITEDDLANNLIIFLKELEGVISDPSEILFVVGEPEYKRIDR